MKHITIHMKIIIFSILLVFVTSLSRVSNAQEMLTADQEEQFRSRAKQLLMTYSEANAISKDFMTVDPDLVQQLNKSFVFSSKDVIYNDLLPEKVEGSKYLTPAAYAQFAQRFYPEGLDVRLDIIDVSVSSTKPRSDGSYEAVVKAKKELKGLYGNARIHSYSDVLFFYVKGVLEEGQIKTLGISMVVDSKKHAQKQANREYRGLYAGISGGYSYSTLFSSELFSSTSEWQPMPGNAILPSIELHFMLTRGFGFATGLRMGTYSPSIYLDQFNGKLNTTFIDIDQDSYYPIYNISDLEEFREYQTYDIPVVMKFRTGTGKVGLYLDAGVMFSMFKSVNYSVSGVVSRKGEYPNLGNVILEDIDDYGYFTNKEYSSTDVYSLTPPSSGMSAMFSIGLAISPARNFMLKVGLTGSYGLTDLSYNAEDTSLGLPPVDYYHTTGRFLGETLLHAVSVDLGVYYKIF